MGRSERRSPRYLLDLGGKIRETVRMELLGGATDERRSGRKVAEKSKVERLRIRAKGENMRGEKKKRIAPSVSRPTRSMPLLFPSYFVFKEKIREF